MGVAEGAENICISSSALQRCALKEMFVPSVIGMRADAFKRACGGCSDGKQEWNVYSTLESGAVPVCLLLADGTQLSVTLHTSQRDGAPPVQRAPSCSSTCPPEQAPSLAAPPAEEVLVTKAAPLANEAPAKGEARGSGEGVVDDARGGGHDVGGTWQMVQALEGVYDVEE